MFFSLEDGLHVFGQYQARQRHNIVIVNPFQPLIAILAEFAARFNAICLHNISQTLYVIIRFPAGATRHDHNYNHRKNRCPPRPLMAMIEWVVPVNFTAKDELLDISFNKVPIHKLAWVPITVANYMLDVTRFLISDATVKFATMVTFATEPGCDSAVEQ